MFRSADRTFLFDAGSGADHFISERFSYVGLLLGDLAPAGIDAASVMEIVIAYMHIDHIGGLARNGARVFPNATIHISATGWDFWTKEGLADSIPEGLNPMGNAVQTVGGIVGQKVKTPTAEANRGAGVGLIAAPGHTPGHRTVMLTSGSEQLMLLGDAIVTEKVHFANPEAAWTFEFAPQLAAKTRRSLLDRVTTDKSKFAGGHLSGPGAGPPSIRMTEPDMSKTRRKRRPQWHGS